MVGWTSVCGIELGTSEIISEDCPVTKHLCDELMRICLYIYSLNQL